MKVVITMILITHFFSGACQRDSLLHRKMIHQAGFSFSPNYSRNNAAAPFKEFNFSGGFNYSKLFEGTKFRIDVGVNYSRVYYAISEYKSSFIGGTTSIIFYDKKALEFPTKLNYLFIQKRYLTVYSLIGMYPFWYFSSTSKELPYPVENEQQIKNEAKHNEKPETRTMSFCFVGGLGFEIRPTEKLSFTLQPEFKIMNKYSAYCIMVGIRRNF